jgi:hypothetical protein
LIVDTFRKEANPVALGGDQRAKIFEAILKAYPTYSDLERMFSLEFNRNLREIVAESRNHSDVVFGLVRWAEAQDLISDLVAAARKHNPQNMLLMAVDALVQQSAAQSRSLESHRAPEASAACIVHHRRVFINRREFRHNLSRMREDDGPRILSINGTTGLGKSHSLHLISYVVTRTQNSEFGEIDLKRTPSKQITPDQLVRSLAVQMGFPIKDDIFVQGAQSAWWTFELADWLARQADKSGKACWIVLDGFEHPAVPQPTHEFIQHLLQACAKRDRLRLILLDFREDRIPAEIHSFILVEQLREISETELRQFFGDLYAHHGVPINGGAAQLAGEIWAEVQTVRGTPDFTKRLAEAVLRVIKKKFPNGDL